MIQFSSSVVLKLKEINDATQNFYGLKQCQKNNGIQNMARVNRPKDEQLCLISEKNNHIIESYLAEHASVSVILKKYI